jgi:hypothetical protein
MTEPTPRRTAQPAAAATQRRPDAQVAAGVELALTRTLPAGERRRIDFGAASDARYGEPDAPAGTPAGAVVASLDPDDPARGALLAMPSYGALTGAPELPGAAAARREATARRALAVALTVLGSGLAGWALAHAAPAPSPAPPSAVLPTTTRPAAPPPPQERPFLPRYPFGGTTR